MNNIVELLNRLSQILMDANSPLAGMLQKGIDRSTIDAKISELNIVLPYEAYSLFNWRNGMLLTGDRKNP